MRFSGLSTSSPISRTISSIAERERRCGGPSRLTERFCLAVKLRRDCPLLQRHEARHV
jgi:hypothetical protein